MPLTYFSSLCFPLQVERGSMNLCELKRSIARGGMERRAFDDYNEEKGK